MTKRDGKGETAREDAITPHDAGIVRELSFCRWLTTAQCAAPRFGNLASQTGGARGEGRR